MDSTMLKANVPAPSETLSDIIFKHAIAGNLGGLRKVEPSEHKVLCYSYMSGRPSSNCSHWIKPGDYVEEYMPVIDDDFFSFRDKIPTSAKAVAIAIEEDGENVPTCLACLCNQYEQTIIRKVGHWIDYNFRMESMAEHLNEFFGTSDIAIEELFNGPYVAYEYCESDLDDHFDPLKSEFFEQWSESVWSDWCFQNAKVGFQCISIGRPSWRSWKPEHGLRNLCTVNVRTLFQNARRRGTESKRKLRFCCLLSSIIKSRVRLNGVSSINRQRL